MDEPTRQMVLKKTWCHGQAVAPIYGVACLIWFAHFDSPRPLSLLYAGLLLPYWSYSSYRAVFTEYSYKTLMLGGLLVEVAHALVFRTAWHAGKSGSDSNIQRNPWNLLMLITSGLFFIETLAFLVVVKLIRGNDNGQRRRTDDFESIQEP